jgi:hypothetical protein
VLSAYSRAHGAARIRLPSRTAGREQTGDPAGAEAPYRQAADLDDIEALRDLAQLREQSGDLDGARAIAQEASDHGDTWTLRHLARLREQTGDFGDAETLYRQAADHGETSALTGLTRLCEQLGDSAAAEPIRRFGLTDDGAPGPAGGARCARACQSTYHAVRADRRREAFGRPT